jgi:4a-hydroxytetrahydrobiopterin dehydratase
MSWYYGGMWQEINDNNKTKKTASLYRHFAFADFKQAFEFMSRVAELAEGVQHHPRWTNEYNNVEVWLSTHSAGDKVTKKDRDLAKAIDAIANEYIA